MLTVAETGQKRDDTWKSHQRSEAPLQRADRNFAELLQELRVLFTGVQILLGFLLTLAFSPGFIGLDGFRHTVYVITLLAAASSSALLIAPVALHRLLFQGGHKRRLVRVGHCAALSALVGLGLTLSAGLLWSSTSPWDGSQRWPSPRCSSSGSGCCGGPCPAGCGDSSDSARCPVHPAR